MPKAVLQSPRTAVELFKLLPEGVYCQVINNTIYMSPSPTFQHQDVIFEISMQIRSYINKKKMGKCIGAPLDVFLDANNAFQPDIIFLSNQNLALVKRDGKIHGAPDFVVEVLSPGNENDDRIKKKKVYESCGVKEYFIVEPSSKQVITYYLKGKKFEEQKAAKAKIVSALLKKTFKF